MWAAAVGGLIPPGTGRVLALTGGALIALVAMRWLPGAPPHLSGQGRTLVDGLIVAGSALLVAWVAGAGAVGFPVAYLAVAAAALVVSTRAHPAARARFATLAAGFGLVAAGGLGVALAI